MPMWFNYEMWKERNVLFVSKSCKIFFTRKCDSFSVEFSEEISFRLLQNNIQQGI